MKQAVRFSLAAGAVALVCACTSDTVHPPIGQPLASFSDGTHEGNPDFFFLPPIFKHPTSHPNFSPGEFNANVRPTVEICELAPLVPPATVPSCATTIKTFAPADITLDPANEQYAVNWHTDESNLVLTKFYRIRVLLGTQELGHADVDPVGTTGDLKNVETGEVIALVNGRTLPIKFRIENGAACNGGDCDSKTIDLSQGGFVVLETTGDRVDIPAQEQSGQVVTVTVQRCDDLDIDLPVFGNCLRVTADPRLLAPRLVPAATVSICSLNPTTLPLLHAQQDLLTLHRQDGETVLALPHADDFCETPIGRSDGLDVWRALSRAVAWIFKPRELHASSMVLDVGQGGQTEGFSDFQFALPAKMEISSLANQATSPNSAVPSVPAVLVTDADGNPVAGASVHFQITSTGGGSIAPVAGTVVSDASGRAALTEWIVGAAGSHALQAFGNGIADPRNNGPAEGFDPFAPAVLHDPEQNKAQPPVSLGTGRLTYMATAGLADLIIESLQQLPVSPTDLDVIEYTAVVRNIGTVAAERVSVVVNVATEATSLFSGPLNPGTSVSLRRQRTLDAIKSLLLRESQVQPLILVVENNSRDPDAVSSPVDRALRLDQAGQAFRQRPAERGSGRRDGPGLPAHRRRCRCSIRYRGRDSSRRADRSRSAGSSATRRWLPWCRRSRVDRRRGSSCRPHS